MISALVALWIGICSLVCVTTKSIHSSRAINSFAALPPTLVFALGSDPAVLHVCLFGLWRLRPAVPSRRPLAPSEASESQGQTVPLVLWLWWVSLFCLVPFWSSLPLPAPRLCCRCLARYFSLGRSPRSRRPSSSEEMSSSMSSPSRSHHRGFPSLACSFNIRCIISHLCDSVPCGCTRSALISP